MKALYLDYLQDLMTTTNIFKKSGYLSHCNVKDSYFFWKTNALVCSKVKVSQMHKIIDVMSCELNLSAIGSFSYVW